MRFAKLGTLIGTAALMLAFGSAPGYLPAQEDAAAESTSAKEKATISDIAAPFYITDVGQGNTARMVELMLARLELGEMKRDDTGKAEDLDGYATLIIGVGGSTKGLGAAGLDVNTEMERTRALIAKAKEMEIPIIGVHTGGEPRRGELSDEFNRLVCENSTAFVVWAGGDQDGFFREITEEHEIHFVEVQGRAEVGTALAGIIRTAADGEN